VVATATNNLFPFDDDWRGIPLPGHSTTHYYTHDAD
jgi:hypothetical protein